MEAKNELITNAICVSRPIPEDRPSEEELFGEVYGSEAEQQ